MLLPPPKANCQLTSTPGCAEEKRNWTHYHGPTSKSMVYTLKGTLIRFFNCLSLSVATPLCSQDKPVKKKKKTKNLSIYFPPLLTSTAHSTHPQLFLGCFLFSLPLHLLLFWLPFQILLSPGTFTFILQLSAWRWLLKNLNGQLTSPSKVSSPPEWSHWHLLLVSEH